MADPPGVIAGATGVGLSAAAVGVGATAFMDLVATLRKRAFDVRPLDYRLVGRWVGGFRRGRIVHSDIEHSHPVRGEAVIGWTTHYLIGAGIASAMTAAAPGWIDRPTLASALVTGLVSSCAPMFVMQPALGLGVAGSRTPNPGLTRWRVVQTHLVYGAGLYLAAHAMRLVRNLRADAAASR